MLIQLTSDTDLMPPTSAMTFTQTPAPRLGATLKLLACAGNSLPGALCRGGYDGSDEGAARQLDAELLGTVLQAVWIAVINAKTGSSAARCRRQVPLAGLRGAVVAKTECYC